MLLSSGLPSMAAGPALAPAALSALTASRLTKSGRRCTFHRVGGGTTCDAGVPQTAHACLQRLSAEHRIEETKMTTSTATIVRYEKRDRIAWVTLNRPEAMNALSPELGQGIADAMARATADEDVLVVVLAGEGGRAFCAGMDLKWRAQTVASGTAATTVGGPGLAFQGVSSCPKPVIAAIDGYCLAGGMQMASRCDMRIATRKSRFGMPEARRSLAAVGSVDTPELFMPAGEAAWILLTGGHMTAERAYDVGYIQALVEDREELFKAAENLANEVKLCGPLALRAIKAVIRVQDNLPTPPTGVRRLDHVAELTREARTRNNDSEDQVEGPKAFAEKRPPVWKNR
ncbi:MAG: enoyl-CoA hydratase/isomerase family protein [Dehalococcoidia bacterium]|nr:enoyl-CoA hydratase/isomerase family protein [Dehalococcoidia bacterium]